MKIEQIKQLMESGREFKITNIDCLDGTIHKFENNKLCFLDSYEDYSTSNLFFNELLRAKIEVLPWKPKENELFWYHEPTEEEGVNWYINNGLKSANIVIDRVPVYSTKEEALANLPWKE